MGELFSSLCKGPVIVIDDRIDTDDLINKLIEEIIDNNLPVFSYKSIGEIKTELPNFTFSNFIILDWKMEERERPPEVQLGAGKKEISEQIVIDFIRELQKTCFAPIFILSNLSKEDIEYILKDKKIIKNGARAVFVENKATLCRKKGTLISKIESWITESPHIYLAKWWTNEWLLNNTKVLWDLYNSNSDWPAWFYDSFKKDEEEPLLALVNSLFQLIYSEMSISNLERSYIEKKVEPIDDELLKSLKKLYARLVYTENEIDKDIRPGDIFRIEEENKKIYLLNIRPECDTTKRKNESDTLLYCLRGRARKSNKLKDRYDKNVGVVMRKTEILLFLLDGNDIVRFDNKELEIRPYGDIKDKKICRVVSPFINQIRQSYCNFLGRVGIPSYPEHIFKSIFKINQEKASEGSK